MPLIKFWVKSNNLLRVLSFLIIVSLLMYVCNLPWVDTPKIIQIYYSITRQVYPYHFSGGYDMCMTSSNTKVSATSCLFFHIAAPMISYLFWDFSIQMTSNNYEHPFFGDSLCQLAQKLIMN